MNANIHFDHISPNSSSNKKMYQEKPCTENRNTHVMLIFFRKACRLEHIPEKLCRAG